MRQQKPPSTPRRKKPFLLFWNSVSANGTELLGSGKETRWAYSEAQARRLLHVAFEKRFGRKVFVSWSEEAPIGDYPEPQIIARRQILPPSQIELFPVHRVLSRVS